MNYSTNIQDSTNSYNKKICFDHQDKSYRCSVIDDCRFIVFCSMKSQAFKLLQPNFSENGFDLTKAIH